MGVSEVVSCFFPLLKCQGGTRSFLVIRIVNWISRASMVGLVDTQHFFRFRYTEPIERVERKKHGTACNKCPGAVSKHGVKLVAKELGFTTVKEAYEFFFDVVRVGHECYVDHSRGTSGQVASRGVERIVDEENLYK